MRKSFPFINIALIFLSNIAFSQVINSSGQNTINDNFELTWSLGETYNSLSSSADEGFLSGYNIIIKNITAVKSQKEFQISIYPNPTQNFIHLENKDLDTHLKIVVLDANGRRNIISTEFNKEGKCKIPIHNLSSGMYFIKVIDDRIPDNPQIFKIIKK